MCGKSVQINIHVKTKKLKVSSQSYNRLKDFKKRLALLRAFEICVTGNSKVSEWQNSIDRIRIPVRLPLSQSER